MNNRRVFQINAIEAMFEDTEVQNTRPRIFQKRKDYFRKYNDIEFVKRFRLTKATFAIVLDKIAKDITSDCRRKNTVAAETKLLISLRFYASGSFLIVVGDFAGVSVATASRVVKEVSMAIARLGKECINFPNNPGLEETMASFYNIARLPRVIGAIDCTHIKMQSPGGNNAEIYRNRKGYFSINVQAVCNAQLMFQDLVARWPGSAHDSNIFRNSRIKFRLENKQLGNGIILGDSGYKQCNYLMTPLLNPQTEVEKLYNESQIRTRNTIERCFGVWKRRFPVLSLGMRLSMNTIMAIIVACGVLHNIAILEKEPLPPIDDSILMPNELFENIEATTNEVTSNPNCTARTLLIHNYFSRL